MDKKEKQRRINILMEKSKELKVLYSPKVWEAANFPSKGSLSMFLLRHCKVKMKPKEYDIKLRDKER